MWKHRSDMLALLTKMTSKQATWNWTEGHQIAYEHMKKSISIETLLVYPNFSKLFIIHMDASKVQLETVNSQDNKSIAFYSTKLNPAQIDYTAIERELLSIVETLKELRKGYILTIRALHTNLLIQREL